MKYLRLATLSTAVCASLSIAGAREFQDKFGRTIDAELVSHTGVAGDSVTIAKAGKNLVVKIAQFSEADQKFIRSWMKSTPPTIAYNFRVTPKRVSVAAEGEDGLPGEKFELQITNLARATVSDLTVEYRLYMKDYPSSAGDLQSLFERAGGLAGLADAKRGKIEPDLEHIEAKAKVESVLGFNKSATVETKSVQIHSGKNPLNGDRYKDEVVGVIVRILDPAGKVVFVHHDKKTKDFIWEVESPSEEFGISLD